MTNLFQQSTPKKPYMKRNTLPNTIDNQGNASDNKSTKNSQSLAAKTFNKLTAVEYSPTPTNTKAFSFPKSVPLRNQLLQTILPSVLIPLGIAGLIGSGIVTQKTQEHAQQTLESEARIASDVFYQLLKEEAQRIPVNVANNPLVIDAARAAGQSVEKQGLTKLTINELETKFAATKLLQVNPKLNNYLIKTVETGKISQLFFTDKYGFNVAYNQPNSNFVHSDDDWWQKAKAGSSSNQIEPKYDQSYKTFGFEINQPIIDPNNNEFLGVIKAVVPVSRLSLVFNSILEDLNITGSKAVQLLALKEDGTVGVINTITATDTRSDQNQELLGGEQVAKNVTNLLKTFQSKQEEKATKQIQGMSVKPGISKLGGALMFGEFDAQGRHYQLLTVPQTNWIVAVSIENDEIKKNTVETSLLFLGVFLVLGVIITATVAIIARRIANCLGQLVTTAQQLSTGNLDVSAELVGATENQILAGVFNHLVERIKKIIADQESETEQVKILAEVIAQIRQSLNQETLFTTTVYGLQSLLKAERVILYCFKPDLQSGEIIAESLSSPWPSGLGEVFQEELKAGVIELYKMGRASSFEDINCADLTDSNVELLNHLGVVANLIAPIVVGGELFGLLYAHQCSGPRVWKESEKQAIQQIATQLGDALHQVKLLQQQQLTAEFSQKLHETTSKLRESLDREQIFMAAVKKTRIALNSQRTLIYLLDENQLATIMAESVATGWPTTLGKVIAHPFFIPEYLEQLQQGKVIAVDNLKESNLTTEQLSRLNSLEVKANLIAPILVQGKLLGLLAAHQCSNARNWQKIEIDFLRQVAVQLGFALEQAALLEKTEKISQEQRQQKETFQHQLMKLLSDIDGATRGDLTVRAEVSSGEIGTVADFFNSIVESLRTIVMQVKLTAVQVNSYLKENDTAVHQLADDALKQAEETTSTLDSIEQMTRSMQAVASSADKAAEVARTASNTAEASGEAMNLTVQSILDLRETIGETAKKVKRLGESSQQISKVVSLINQIALQTNLLAINAGIEAARAGEDGRGFAVVAEEVGELATRCTIATQEIEKIVQAIQQETTQVVKAMEQSTSQVVEGTRRVEDAKRSLGQIISYQIDQLLQAISEATVSQTQTSLSVSVLMKEIAQVSERTSISSRQVSNSLQQTVVVAKELQESVGAFRVEAKTF
jgi:methyl-accepting chemotaxis protein PixJ